MKTFEKILRMTQAKLFKYLANKFENSVGVKDNYILVEGTAPIMLVAHLDTVHAEPVKVICKSDDGNIIMSPQGIGGDDRCGVYALLKAYELADKKPYLLFTCDEEVGGLGAECFAADFAEGYLPNLGLEDLKLIIEIDRKGSNDAVYYDCHNDEFEEYITSKGFVIAHGSFSDISVVAPELGVAAVNLSSGYYNAHTPHEYIVLSELENTIKRVIEIVNESDKFPRYKYVNFEIRKFCKKYYGTDFGDFNDDGYGYDDYWEHWDEK